MTKRFEEGKRRTKADTQKRLYIKKNESSRNEKKAIERFGVTKKKNVRSKMKVILGIKTK